MCLGRANKLGEVTEITKPWVNAVVITDVVTVVAVQGGVEGHEPDTGDTDAGEIIEALRQAAKVPDTIAVAVHVSFDIQAVEDGVLPPKVDHRLSRHANHSSDAPSLDG